MLRLLLFVGCFCSFFGGSHPFVRGGVGPVSRPVAAGGVLRSQIAPQNACQRTYQHGIPCDKLRAPYSCSIWPLSGVRPGKESSGWPEHKFAASEASTPASMEKRQPLIADKEPGLFEGILTHAKHLFAVIEQDASKYSMMKVGLVLFFLPQLCCVNKGCLR